MLVSQLIIMIIFCITESKKHYTCVRANHTLLQTILYCKQYKFSCDINFSCWSYI